jgi:hypothetical protein
VIAVAGSNGKTSTKDLLAAALGSVLDVHASKGNLNNQIGVPLTLLALRDEADVAVVEMGTNMPGEVALLRAIGEPDVAVVTSIGEEHLEGLGDLAGVLREEAAIFEGAAVGITPASQPEVAAAARGKAGRVVSAGLDAGDVRASRWEIAPDGLGVILIDGVEVRPPLRGAHNLRNTMLALAAARECGVSVADAARRGGARRSSTPPTPPPRPPPGPLSSCPPAPATAASASSSSARCASSARRPRSCTTTSPVWHSPRRWTSSPAWVTSPTRSRAWGGATRASSPPRTSTSCGRGSWGACSPTRSSC